MRKSGFVKATSIEYHRNGVGGVGFHVVLFKLKEDGKIQNMVATVFPLEEGQTWNGLVTVLDADMVADGNTKFGENSWRGDVYETELRDAIEAYQKKRDADFDAMIVKTAEKQSKI